MRIFYMYAVRRNRVTSVNMTKRLNRFVQLGVFNIIITNFKRVINNIAIK